MIQNHFLIFLIIFTATIVTDVGFCGIDKDWEAWKKQHKVHYKNPAEEKRRHETYLRNRALVYKSNLLRDESGFTIALNQFADMTDEEISTKLLTLKIPKSRKKYDFNDHPDEVLETQISRPKAAARTFTTKGKALKATVFTKATVATRPTTKVVNFTVYSFPNTTGPTSPLPLPDTMDWRAYGAVSSVKNQTKTCGACWAFVVAAALEGHLKLKTGRLVPLSAQNLLDCAGRGMGCWGGWMNPALQYVRDVGGINTDEAYPYKAAKGSCQFNKSDDAKFAAVKPGHAFQTVGSNDMALMKALLNGPVMAAVNGRPKTFLLYKSGVFNDTSCSAMVNHALLVIGYGTDHLTQQPYWLLKNSWGEHWGEHGYIRMLRGKGNICGVLGHLSYPVLAD